MTFTLRPRPLQAAAAGWIAALALILAGAAAAQAPAPPPAVGYQQLEVADTQGPPVEVGVWYPTAAPARPDMIGLFPVAMARNAPVEGHRLALIVMSHGNGGVFNGHHDTAEALARAGYVVAALTHTGDNYRDQSRAIDLPNRTRQLRLLTDFMLTGWRDRGVVDPQRIGAFGFSAGGFTVLAAAGGEPDFATVRPHCAARPGAYDCRLLLRSPALAAALEQAKPHWTHDPRLKALVVAAPALGFAFGREGLTHVQVPVQLWKAEADQVLPAPDYADAVRRDLPASPEFHIVPNAQHFDFLSPCSPGFQKVAPMLCVERAGFSREAFHEAFNASVVAFFDHHLKP